MDKIETGVTVLVHVVNLVVVEQLHEGFRVTAVGAESTTHVSECFDHRPGEDGVV